VLGHQPAEQVEAVLGGVGGDEEGDRAEALPYAGSPPDSTRSNNGVRTVASGNCGCLGARDGSTTSPSEGAFSRLLHMPAKSSVEGCWTVRAFVASVIAVTVVGGPGLVEQRLGIPEPVLGDIVVVVGESQRRAEVLRYWRALELLAPQNVERVNERKGIHAARAGRPLPWQDERPTRRRSPRDDLVSRYTVFGGVFCVDRIHATLERVFGASGEDFDERTPRSDSALFSITVTEDGRPLLDSLVLSTAGWAVGRAVDPGPADPGWLDGFAGVANRHAAAVREFVAAAEDDAVATALRKQGVQVGRPIGYDDLVRLVELTAGLLGVKDLLSPDEIRIFVTRVRRRRANDDQSDFLNSFHIDDLQRVGDAVAGGDCGAALATFLTPDAHLDVAARRDVRQPEHAGLVQAGVAPGRVPAGRWPAKAEHPLALSQQLAVNEVLDRLGSGAGIFAVNGPPGTGKTTMLRDLIAALVVARARALATLRRPVDAFSGTKHTWKTDKATRTVVALRPELTGFEIVVASANNGAIENVTKEIPQAAAIDASWAGEASYFADHATRVLGQPAWGLIAGALGNKGNRDAFVSRLWWGDPADLTAADQPTPGFREHLSAVQATGAPDWSTTVAAFRAALRDEERLRAARAAVQTALDQHPGLRAACTAAEQATTDARRHHDRAASAAHAATHAARRAREAAEAARGRRVEHLQFKPGFLEILLTLGRAIRRWHAEDAPLAAAVADADRHATATATAEHATNAARDTHRQLSAAQIH